MSKTASITLDANVLAVVHRAGGSWRVVVATTREGRPSILDTREVPATRMPGEADPLESMLSQHRVGRIIGVLPASRVVCRTCSLPNADREQLDQALRLQAEAHLMSGGHEYRTAMSILPAAAGETSRCGLIVHWPETAEVDALPGAGVAGRKVSWAPDVAALAALIDGQRPSDPIVWLDRPSGSVALAITHTGGAMFRCTREEAESVEDWQQRVTSAMAETALSVGHTGGYAEGIVHANEQAVRNVGPGGATLIVGETLTASAARRIDGTRPDRDWWSVFGIAVGVLIAANGDLASLTALRESPELERPSRIQTIATALSRPSVAVKAIVACIVIFALTPPAVSRLRLAVLELRHPNLEEETRAVDETKERLAMYRALDEEAFSVTKVLSDVVSNTPRGIQLKSIRIQLNDRSFAVSGEAVPHDGRSAPEVVAQMQDHLRDCRLFSGIKLSLSDPNAYRTYKFDLSAKITEPYWRSPYDVDRDFARWPLVVREAGKGPIEDEAETADATDEFPDEALAASTGDETMDEPIAAVPAVTENPPGTTSLVAAEVGTDEGAGALDGDAPGAEPASRNVSDGGRTRIGSGATIGGRGDRDERLEASKIDRGAIPAPITEAQIDAMTSQEVSKQLTAVAKAKNKLRRDDDPELFDRLKNEFDLLMARMRERR